MALAETARLIASLGWKDELTPGAAKAGQSVDKLQGKLGTAGKHIGLVGHAISTAFGVGLERVVSKGVEVFTDSLRQGVAGAEELERITGATAQVLKTTGGVAGQTAESVANLADKYEQLNATIDRRVIQSSENLLLTFTNIRSKAFEPALEAALNLNQAMGGGPEGLQHTIIQVGKAINDPVTGITALRRVGVSFSKDQIAQIKLLEKHNHLYAAQKIVLQELSKEFGGQYAKAGQTAEAQAAALRDAVEELQITFAQGLLPGLTNVRKGLTTAFRDPTTIAAVKDLGTNIGSFLSPENVSAGISLVKQGFQAIHDVPWDAVKSAMQITGQASKAVFDAFNGLPDWVKTAVITGWGFNKITGGALTGIAGFFAKALVLPRMGVRANIVQVEGPVAGGRAGAGPGALGGGTGGLAGKLGTGLALASIAADIAGVVTTWQQVNQSSTDQAKSLHTMLDQGIKTKTPQELQKALDGVNQGIKDIQSNPLLVLVQGDALNQLKGMRTDLQRQLGQPVTVEPTNQPGSIGPGRAGAFGRPPLPGPTPTTGVPGATRDMDKNLPAARDIIKHLATLHIDLKELNFLRAVNQSSLPRYLKELRERMGDLKKELKARKPASEGSKLIAARIKGVHDRERDVQNGVKALKNSQDPKLTKLITRSQVDGDRLRSLQNRLHIAKDAHDGARAKVLQGKINQTNRDLTQTKTAIAHQVQASGADMTRAGYAAAQAATTAGYTSARAQSAAADRIVAAIYANRPVISSTNASRAGTNKKRAGPTGGSSNTPRVPTGDDIHG